MSNPYRWMLLGALLIGAAATAQTIPQNKIEPLRICADPGNMPLSDKSGQGFQNRVAELLARSLNRPLEYYWYPYYARGLARNTINADRCDVLMDVTSDYELAALTKPYYKSTFVLVYPKAKNHAVTSLDDPILKQWRIGTLQSSPAREALRMRDVFENTEVEYAFMDTRLHPDAGPSLMVRKTIAGEVDAAEAWGPIAGYFIAQQHAPLEMVPLNLMEPAIPLEYAMALGVRRSNKALRDQLNTAIEANKDAIKDILTAYGVPLVQCAECVISGTLPAHGPYTELATAKEKAAGDHPESSAKALEDLKQRVAAGADLNMELAGAVTANDPGRVSFLLDKGANPDEVAQLDHNALQLAVRQGHVAVATLLLDHGANADLRDDTGWSPLMLAVLRNDDEMVRTLLAHHASIDGYNANGWNALSVAITYDKLDRVRQLVQAGADVNAANGAGYTPLMFAAAKSAAGVMELLLTHGAKVDSANKAGITALMIAAAANNEKAVRALLGAGADRGTRNLQGKTALDVAREKENEQVAAVLSAS